MHIAMTQRNSTVLALLVGAIFFLIVLFFRAYEFTSDGFRDKNISSTEVDIPKTYTHESTSSTSNEHVAFSSIATSSPIASLSPSEVNRVELWQLEHGYFSEADLDEYRNYDLSTLQKLASTGDLKAIELVARDRMSKGQDAYLDFHHAAVRGSTHAFVALSFLLESKFQSALNDEGKIQYSIEILALLKTAGKRGDEYASSIDAESFKRRFDFKPTKEQELKIDQLSQKIYDQLASLRQAAGLSPFDNTPSPEIKKALNINKQNIAADAIPK